MFEITVSGTFTASHRLRYPDGAREELHEHEWRVRVTYAGPTLDRMGVLFDFVPLRRRLDEVLAALTAGELEARPAFAGRNASTEHVAAHVAAKLPQTLSGDVRLRSVEVEEEPGCFARYFPDHSS